MTAHSTPARRPPPNSWSFPRLVTAEGSLDAPLKAAKPSALKICNAKNRRDTDRHVSEFLGQRHRQQHLLQVDTRFAGAEDIGAGGIRRIHPAIARKGQRDGIQIRVANGPPIHGDIRQEEGISIAFECLAGRRKLTERQKHRRRQISLILGVNNSRWVERGRRCIGAVGNTGTGQSLGAGSNAIQEIAVCRLSTRRHDRRCHGEHQYACATFDSLHR